MSTLEDYPAQEIEGIWKRVKQYIDTKQIKSISRDMIAEEIETQMLSSTVPRDREKNPQATMDFLVHVRFPQAIAKNKTITNTIIGGRIKAVKVKGRTRFQIIKGTPTIRFDGKSIRAGQFVAGKTESDAIKNIRVKVGE